MNELRYTAEESEKGALVVTFHGFSGEKTFKDMEPIFLSLIEQGQNKIIVNLENIEYVDSKGWGTFLWAAELARDRNGDVVLAQANIEVQKIYQLIGIEEFIKIYPTIAEAENVLCAME